MNFSGIGSISLFAQYYVPEGYIPCDGRSLNKIEYPELYGILGEKFGSESPSYFNVPNYLDSLLLGHKEGVVDLAETKSIDIVTNLHEVILDLYNSLSVAPNELEYDTSFEQWETNISLANAFANLKSVANLLKKNRESISRTPTSYYIQARHNETLQGATPYPFCSEIRAYTGTEIPEGWLECDGQQISVDENQMLFSLLYDDYGDYVNHTFTIPDFRGKALTGIDAKSKLDIDQYKPVTLDKVKKLIEKIKLKLTETELPAEGRINAEGLKKYADQISDDQNIESKRINIQGVKFIICQKWMYPAGA